MGCSLPISFPYPRGQTLPQLGAGNRAQARLRLLGKAGENHRDVITGVLVASAGDHDSRTVDLAAITRGLQGNSHLRPLGEGRRSAKLDAILVDDHRVGGEGQARLPGFDSDFLERTSAFSSS